MKLCIDYRDKHKDHTTALMREHERVNDKNTKKSTVRILQKTGEIDDSLSTEEYLEQSDVDVELLDADFQTLPQDI